MIKTCISCGLSDDSKNFKNKRNICRECYNKRNRSYQKKYRKTSRGKRALRIAQNRWRAIPKNYEKLKNLRNKWARTMDGLFPQAKSIAKKSGRVWEISRENYEKLRNLKCHYCEGPLPETGVGLDRLDNTRGYQLNNVVPCCTLCNMARRNQFTPGEMKTFIGPAIKKIRRWRADPESIAEEVFG